jgi:4-amino-4-deoxy-L-arabinose transferase-like glycosyltransferase
MASSTGGSIAAKPWLVLLLLIVGYLIATLPFLSDYPPVGADQVMIAEPASNLAEHGIYGSRLLRGYFRADQHNYDHMPVYALPMALIFKAFGTSVLHARLLSVFYGALLIVLTFALGRRLYDDGVGVAAAAALCLLRLGYGPDGSGVPLFDIARIIRFEILVPVWVVGACLCLDWAYRRQSPWGFFLTGVLGALAALTHVYGAFVLAVPVVVLLWHEGPGSLRRAPLYLVALGAAVAMLPWVLYVAQDFPAYQGQMLRHRDRMDLLNPWFYVTNLVEEPRRFLPWFGGSVRHPVLWPRLGIWFLAVGVAVANVLLWRGIRARRRFEDRLLLAALPVMWLLLASTILLKRYVYVMVLMPFFALQVGLAWTWAWRRLQHRRYLRGLLLVVATLAVVETGAGVLQSLQAARATSSYLGVTERLLRVVPPNARVMALSHYWFGLRERDVYSLDLIFVLTGQRFGHVQPPSVSQIIDRVAPDYLIVQEELLEAYNRNPQSLANAELGEQWRSLDAYIDSRCATLVHGQETVGYGRVLVFRCVRALTPQRVP